MRQEKRGCYKETKAEGDEQAVNAHAEGEGQDVAGRDVYQNVADKGYPHHRHDVRGAAQGIGVTDLHGIAELIKNEGWDEADSQHHNFGVARKDADKEFAEQQKDERRTSGHTQQNVASGSGGKSHVFPVVQTVEGGSADAQSGAKAVIEKEAEGTDGYHHLERGKVNSRSNRP